MTMPRLHRFRRIAKWIGIILCALILVSWVLSVPTIGNRRLTVYRWTPTAECGLLSGTLFWETYPANDSGSAPYWSIWWNTETLKVVSPYGIRLPSRHSAFTIDVFFLPFWLPFVIVVIPTAILWHRHRRRIPPGHCAYCNYNLTGNTTGICPECGTPIPKKESPTI